MATIQVNNKKYLLSGTEVVKTPEIPYDNIDFEAFMTGFNNPSSLPITNAPNFALGPDISDSVDAGALAFQGAVLGLNGKVYFAPTSALEIGVYDPITNTYTRGPTINTAQSENFCGAVLTSRGEIVFVPARCDHVGIFNPKTNVFSLSSEAIVGGTWFGGVLLQDGKVLFIPYSGSSGGTIVTYDVETDTIEYGETIPSEECGFSGGVLAADGTIIFIPNDAPNIGIYDPVTKVYTKGPEHGQGGNAFCGGALLPDGRIIMSPSEAPYAMIYNPLTQEVTPIFQVLEPRTYGNCTLLPDGKVLFLPNGGSILGLYDSVAETYETFSFDGLIASENQFLGGVLTPNGKVILAPSSGRNVGICNFIGLQIGEGYCIHPILNKF